MATIPQEPHNYFMGIAFSLAEKSRGCTAPNPMVGCVIVKNNQILGSGYHRRAGFNHAEVEAIEDCIKNGHEKNIINSTVYVTLEPCCHMGKTGPCVEALIKYQVKRVIIAITDPNPLVAGKGIEKLKAAGIEVITGVGEIEALRLNKGFITRMTKNRPFIISKIAASLDGKVALKNGESKWITNSKCREDVHLLRYYSDAIVTTARTVLADNPAMTVRHQLFQTHPKQLLRVVIDKALSTEPSANIYQDQAIARTIIITTKCVLDSVNMVNREKLEIFKSNKIGIFSVEPSASDASIYSADSISISKLWELLATFGCNDVLVEAGGRFNGYLLANQLVDEWIIYQSGLIMGNNAQNMFNYESNSNSLSGLFKLKCEHIKQFGSDWRLTFSSESV